MNGRAHTLLFFVLIDIISNEMMQCLRRQSQWLTAEAGWRSSFFNAYVLNQWVMCRAWIAVTPLSFNGNSHAANLHWVWTSLFALTCWSNNVWHSAGRGVMRLLSCILLQCSRRFESYSLEHFFEFAIPCMQFFRTDKPDELTNSINYCRSYLGPNIYIYIYIYI